MVEPLREIIIPDPVCSCFVLAALAVLVPFLALAFVLVLAFNIVNFLVLVVKIYLLRSQSLIFDPIKRPWDSTPLVEPQFLTAPT